MNKGLTQSKLNKLVDFRKTWNGFLLLALQKIFHFKHLIPSNASSLLICLPLKSLYIASTVISIEFKHLSFHLGTIEPFFGSAAVYDLNRKIKLSETVYFDLNSDIVSKMMPPEVCFFFFAFEH